MGIPINTLELMCYVSVWRTMYFKWLNACAMQLYEFLKYIFLEKFWPILVKSAQGLKLLSMYQYSDAVPKGAICSK